MTLIAIGDKKGTVKTNHPCDATTTTEDCSTTVFIRGVGVVRSGDKDSIHTYKVGDSCPPHQKSLTTFSNSVKTDGKGVGRVGDSYSGEDITNAGQQSVSAGD